MFQEALLRQRASRSSGEQALLKHAGAQMQESDLLHHEHFSTPNLS